MTNNNFTVGLTEGPIGRAAKQVLMTNLLNRYPFLSVAGMDSPFYANNGDRIKSIEYAGKNDLISFGGNRYHDVDFRKKSVFDDYRIDHYDIVKDWETVCMKLDIFANERKNKQRNLETSKVYEIEDNPVYKINGQDVSIFDNFIKIGTTIIPRKLNKTFITKHAPHVFSLMGLIAIAVR